MNEWKERMLKPINSTRPRHMCDGERERNAVMNYIASRDENTRIHTSLVARIFATTSAWARATDLFVGRIKNDFAQEFEFSSTHIEHTHLISKIGGGFLEHALHLPVLNVVKRNHNAQQNNNNKKTIRENEKNGNKKLNRKREREKL